MTRTKVALGVSSSIGLYKACEIVRGFQKAGVEVQVVMTPNAARLISPLLFSSLAGTKTIVEMFEEPAGRSIRHVALAREIALLCVAPATANVIGKFAGGVADDFLSTLFLATTAPVLIAPAMNEAMYLDRTTQANMDRLKALGAEFVEAEKGYLACGDAGWGRLAEPEAIVREGLRILARTSSLAGRTVLVTAGPTREHLDPVRFLSNPSSGKMGYELAREAVARGARTILVSGPTGLVPPAGAMTESVVSAAEMEKACLKAFPKAGIVVMAAAVSDFRFKEPRGRKSAKEEIGLSLAVERTPDILARLGRAKKPGQVLVGFAAETHDVAAHARRKMAAKKADLMVANAVGAGRGFGTETNEVLIIAPSGPVQAAGPLSKREIARLIFDRIEALLEKKRR
ncbi:MAG TPA: bifunctional phosphopantothenoylcysteine decarboxylase/phosphopantothenate--cysteine ligase CoaBC [Candidatus Aminicenantes bacterium]|nr:bifunctional phosphopantothenoylcysteine decarboxylase/phosphopantothenate--cysteine ligase CoaBC [Candidatus Aminicenantes bacterium]HRY65038.1 bifunctional phosphopantothenoylcysteine decarboxylase/phosphopantothenate--cysteine ligase CoaBC [Candidatus Aminicenantes bacterium]HRZ71951.1 bifunctional phosphopantothenoylcysteine decarboxylase/phosphopantothenate--cysteine ligase CoaBC [Candidatus Aminicenantes bacterium]